MINIMDTDEIISLKKKIAFNLRGIYDASYEITKNMDEEYFQLILIELNYVIMGQIRDTYTNEYDPSFYLKRCQDLTPDFILKKYPYDDNLKIRIEDDKQLALTNWSWIYDPPIINGRNVDISSDEYLELLGKRLNILRDFWNYIDMCMKCELLPLNEKSYIDNSLRKVQCIYLYYHISDNTVNNRIKALIYNGQFDPSIEELERMNHINKTKLDVVQKIYHEIGSTNRKYNEVSDGDVVQYYDLSFNRHQKLYPAFIYVLENYSKINNLDY